MKTAMRLTVSSRTQRILMVMPKWRLERWVVREFGVLGFAFGLEFGLKLEPRPKLLVTGLGLSWSPIQACDGVRVWVCPR